MTGLTLVLLLAQQVLQVLTVKFSREILAKQVLPDQLDPLALQELTVVMELLDPRGLRVLTGLALQARLVQLVPLVRLEKLDLRVLRAALDKALQVLPDPLEHQAPAARQDRQGHKEHQVFQLPDLQAQLDKWDQPALQAQRDHKVLQVNQLQVQQVQRELQAHLEQLDQLALKGLPDRVLLALRVLLERLELQVQLDQLVHKVLLDFLSRDQRVRQGQQARRVRQDQLGLKVLQVRALQDLPDLQAQLVQPEKRVLLDRKVLPDKALLAPRVLREQLAK